MVSATTSKGSPLHSSSAAFTTPGPETPTLIAASPSPTPWNAPAIKGLSSTALANTTSLAHAPPSLSAVRCAASLMTCPMSLTASMFSPAFVVPTLTEEQTTSVVASASGMARISRSSALVMALCTSAEKPPRKLTPTALAARSSVWASFTGSAPAQISAAGVMEMRLLTIGIPNSRSMASPVGTRFSA